MIALLRFELWRAFWVALILTVVFAAPLLEHNEGGVLALIEGQGSSRELLRFALGLPFGLALVQFGLDRWLGLQPTLLHRGTPARKIQLAKSIVGLSLVALSLIGVLLLEWQVEQRSGEPAYAARRGLWVLPQVLCLGLLSYSAGELAVRISRRGALLTGLRIAFAYFCLFGAHHWAKTVARELPLAGNLPAYCLLVGVGGALLWRHSHRTYGRPESTTPPSEARLAWLAALACLALWPNVDRVRQQTGAYLRGRLEPRFPSLWIDSAGQVAELVREDRQQRLLALDGSLLQVSQKGAPKGFEALPFGHPEGITQRRIEIEGQLPYETPAKHGEFQSVDQVRSFAIGGVLPAEHFDEFGAEFALADRVEPGSAGLVQLLPSRKLALRVQANLPEAQRRGDGFRVYGEFELELPGQQTLSAHSRELFGCLLFDPDSARFWLVDPALGRRCVSALSGPPGTLKRALALYDGELWAKKARLSSAGDAVETDQGRFSFEAGAWQPLASDSAAVPLEELANSGLPTRLVVDNDLLGHHQGRVIDAQGATLKRFDLSRQGGSAAGRRRMLLFLRLLAPPALSFERHDSALLDLELGRGLPAWVRPLHLGLGLFAAAWAWRRQQSLAGRIWAALFAGLLGPAAVLALVALRSDRDQALKAGARGPRALEPIFSDRDTPRDLAASRQRAA